MRALEDLIDLRGGLGRFQALFDDIGREFKLTESYKVSCNEVEDLVVAQLVLELEHILHKVVAEWILNQEVDTADDHLRKG